MNIERAHFKIKIGIGRLSRFTVERRDSMDGEGGKIPERPTPRAEGGT
jgi:hypothetical protein